MIVFIFTFSNETNVNIVKYLYSIKLVGVNIMSRLDLYD